MKRWKRKEKRKLENRLNELIEKPKKRDRKSSTSCSKVNLKQRNVDHW